MTNEEKPKTANELRDLAMAKHNELFGPTPQFKRLDDIKEEADELYGYTDEDNLKEELSDLISSCFAFAAEKGWTIDELIQMNIDKLNERKENNWYATHV